MASILQDKKKLEEAISSTNSIRDALHFLGLRSAGGNYAAFHKACEKFNLTPSDKWRSLMAANFSKERSLLLEDILVKNSTYTNRFFLKKKCYAVGILKEECYECGLGPVWNGKPLTLQLEHKNGIWNDNRIENLEILCPNCHTQTKTYAGKSTVSLPPKVTT